jgi:uncharacterized metal-binding protein YceD (DUF177 family)
MKVHLQQIPSEGKHIEGEAENDFLRLDTAEPIQPISPVRYALDVGLSDGGLFATGSVSVDFDLACVKCLEPFSYPVTIEDFACQVELTGAEMVDLTPLVREDILLALPPHPHCDWSGQKTCKHALRQRQPEFEDKSERSEVWGALDQLKINKTN